MAWTTPQIRQVGYVIKKADDWDVVVYDLQYLKDVLDGVQTQIVTFGSALKVYPTGGVYIGSSPSDPGANNLTVQGSITIGWQTSYQSKDSTGMARQLASIGGDNNWYFQVGPGGYWVIRNVAGTTNIFTLQDSGLVKAGADQLIVHRHPYGGNRHIEVGQVTISTVNANSNGSVNVTFTKAFSSTPRVITGLQVLQGARNGQNVCTFADPVSTTGCSVGISNSNGVAISNAQVSWIAEGPD